MFALCLTKAIYKKSTLQSYLHKTRNSLWLFLEQKTEFSYRTLTCLWQPVAVMHCYVGAVLTARWLFGDFSTWL